MVSITQPKNPTKKLAVILANGVRIEFGQAGASDYTIHHDQARKARYIARHAPRENWGATGVRTAGFWARWLLWNKPSLAESLADVRERFGEL